MSMMQLKNLSLCKQVQDQIQQLMGREKKRLHHKVKRSQKRRQTNSEKEFTKLIVVANMQRELEDLQNG